MTEAGLLRSYPYAGGNDGWLDGVVNEGVVMRRRKARLGRAVENVAALDFVGRTWDDPFKRDPEEKGNSLVVEVDPFPEDRNDTIVLGNAAPRDDED